MQLNIVLVEPRIPQNTGNIARTCAATGARLHIVKPMGFTPSDRYLKRAGLDYWHFLDITYYDSIEHFFDETDSPYYFFTTKGANVYSNILFPDKSYILFGREDAGLPEELLYKNKEYCLRIPMIEEARSLNLSNSVAIATFEILRQWNFPLLSAAGKLKEYFSHETNS